MSYEHLEFLPNPRSRVTRSLVEWIAKARASGVAASEFSWRRSPDGSKAGSFGIRAHYTGGLLDFERFGILLPSLEAGLRRMIRT